MIYRKLGGSGLIVSKIGLGTMNFGLEIWGCSENNAIDIINYYLDNGGNHIDTADIYAATETEKILGRALKNKKREDIVLATKCGCPLPGGSINYIGASRINIERDLDESLKRLQTDYVDIYYMHNFDFSTPIEESMNTLTNLIRKGKVRYIGASNFIGWQISEAASRWKKNVCMEPIISMQSQYNLIHRGIELEVLPACQYNKIGLVVWGPLAGGLLSGIYTPDGKGPNDERYTTDKKEYVKKAEFFSKRNLEILSKLINIANELGVDISKLATSWIGNNSNVTSFLAGCRNVDHIKKTFEAIDFVIPDEKLKEIDEITKNNLFYPYTEQERGAHLFGDYRFIYPR
jgi:aryl-alcohol dehydrogenase-like predicted oxidoreductase